MSINRLTIEELFGLSAADVPRISERPKLKRLNIWQAGEHSEEITNGQWILAIPEFMPISEAVKAMRDKGHDVGNVSDWYFVEEV